MMHIEHTKVKVRDLVEGYKDDTQTGQVSGWAASKYFHDQQTAVIQALANP